jgi:hypothetical protein
MCISTRANERAFLKRRRGRDLEKKKKKDTKAK